MADMLSSAASTPNAEAAVQPVKSLQIIGSQTGKRGSGCGEHIFLLDYNNVRALLPTAGSQSNLAPRSPHPRCAGDARDVRPRAAFLQFGHHGVDVYAFTPHKLPGGSVQDLLQGRTRSSRRNVAERQRDVTQRAKEQHAKGGGDEGNEHETVESTRPQQSGIQEVRSIGGCENKHAPLAFRGTRSSTVNFSKQLCDYAVHDAATVDAAASRWGQSVNLRRI
jgi:hypothetical protein